jgi:hypothetical protein
MVSDQGWSPMHVAQNGAWCERIEMSPGLLHCQQIANAMAHS